MGGSTRNRKKARCPCTAFHRQAYSQRASSVVPTEVKGTRVVYAVVGMGLVIAGVLMATGVIAQSP
jgi:hypothetical protein